jgi:hypothetical protein
MGNAQALPKIDRAHEQCEMQLPVLVVLLFGRFDQQIAALKK